MNTPSERGNKLGKMMKSLGGLFGSRQGCCLWITVWRGKKKKETGREPRQGSSSLPARPSRSQLAGVNTTQPTHEDNDAATSGGIASLTLWTTSSTHKTKIHLTVGKDAATSECWSNRYKTDIAAIVFAHVKEMNQCGTQLWGSNEAVVKVQA